MDCVDEDAFRKCMGDIGEDTEYLLNEDGQYSILAVVISGQLLTFMFTILTDLSMVEREK